LLQPEYYQALWHEVLSSLLALCLIAGYRAQGWWHKTLSSLRTVPEKWQGHTLAVVMSVCVGAILLNIQRATQRCFDNNRQDCSLGVPELLRHPSFQDTAGWFRVLLQIFPVVGCVLQVPFPAIASLNLFSTFWVMGAIYMHPSRFEWGKGADDEPPSPMDANASALFVDPGLLPSTVPHAVSFLDPNTPSIIRLAAQHIVPCGAILTLVYLLSMQRMHVFVVARDGKIERAFRSVP